MTKRYHAPKRRDRMSGQSPYQRHGKREFLYSADTRAFREKHVSKEQAAAARARTDHNSSGRV